MTTRQGGVGGQTGYFITKVEEHPRRQKNTISSLSMMMTTLVVTAVIITLISAFRQKANKPVFVLLLFASACFIACIFISALGNRPIDNLVMTWLLDTIPANWTEFLDKWWSLHIMRTISELIALVLIAWASVRN